MIKDVLIVSYKGDVGWMYTTLLVKKKDKSMKNISSFLTSNDNAVVIELTDEDLDNVTGGNGMQDFNDYDKHDHDHDRHDRRRHDRHRRGYRY